MDQTTKILIIGANGMLGSMLTKIFFNYNITAWDKTKIDITDKQDVKEKISDLKPEIIINAAAYTAVDDCETNSELANNVNGLGPLNLALVAKNVDAILVHYSTDYIFNGQQKEGYAEDEDNLDPINKYGESKKIGEENILKTWNKHYILRTAWLYGLNGPNFVDTMIRLGKQKEQLKVVNDQTGSPTYSKDLAEATLDILKKNKPFGIYHITNSGTCTWYEFAKEIFYQTNIKIDLQPCTSEEFPTPAKRPIYSVLLNSKIKPLRNWQEALSDYIALLNS